MRAGRWAEWFPPPLVAIALLLVVLIALTPELLPGPSPSAGSLASEAELYVDRSPNANVTTFLVIGLGIVRYAQITLEVNQSPQWPPPSRASFDFGSPMIWNGSLAATLASSAALLALNVTATYVDSTGTSVVYGGIFEFNVSAGVLYYETYLPAAGGLSSIPVTALPIGTLLAIVSEGGPP